MAGESAKIIKNVFDDKEVYDSTCIVKFRSRELLAYYVFDGLSGERLPLLFSALKRGK